MFHLLLKSEETPSPEQTATGKDISNLFMVVGLPKIQKGVQTPHNVDSSRFTSSVQRLVREETTKTLKMKTVDEFEPLLLPVPRDKVTFLKDMSFAALVSSPTTSCYILHLVK